MADMRALRTKMVDSQVRPNDVTDLRIIDAMLEIPRELFVSEADHDLAYIDRNLAVGDGRRLLQAMLVSKAIQSAVVRPSDAVLVVGAATGYTAAVVSRLAGSVVALESDAGLAARARAALASAGASAVTVVTGPLAAGWPAAGPYDVILFDGSVEVVPPALVAQLKDGGRMVVFEGSGLSGRAMLRTRTGAETAARTLFNASAPALPGFAREPAFVF